MKDYRSSAKVGVRIENAVVVDSLSHHPKMEYTVGDGEYEFIVQCNRDWGNREFAVHVMGTGCVTSIKLESAVHGVFGRGVSAHNAKLRRTMRKLIRPQIIQFKYSTPTVCALTGIDVSVDGGEIDHYPIHFKTLVDQFFDHTCLDRTKVAFSRVDYANEFADPSLNEQWRAFHLERAGLRRLSIAAHLEYTRLGIDV